MSQFQILLYLIKTESQKPNLIGHKLSLPYLVYGAFREL